MYMMLRPAVVLLGMYPTEIRKDMCKASTIAMLTEALIIILKKNQNNLNIQQWERS